MLTFSRAEVLGLDLGSTRFHHANATNTFNDARIAELRSQTHPAAITWPGETRRRETALRRVASRSGTDPKETGSSDVPEETLTSAAAAWTEAESNRQPGAYKAPALTVELSVPMANVSARRFVRPQPNKLGRGEVDLQEFRVATWRTAHEAWVCRARSREGTNAPRPTVRRRSHPMRCGRPGVIRAPLRGAAQLVERLALAR